MLLLECCDDVLPKRCKIGGGAKHVGFFLHTKTYGLGLEKIVPHDSVLYLIVNKYVKLFSCQILK